MHEYELIEKKSGRRISTIASRSRVEDAIRLQSIYFPYFSEIRDPAVAIMCLFHLDEDIRNRYELRYVGESRRYGWGSI